MKRRTILGLPLALVAAAGIEPRLAVRADNPVPPGKIAYIRDGSIWMWANGASAELVPGSAMSDARWSPAGNSLAFVRSGNSYSDLYVHDLNSQAETQLTFNKPAAPEGSVEYAAAASWAIDPSWSSSGVLGFISDAQSSNNTFALWLVTNVFTGSPALAPAAKNEDNIDSLSLSPDGSIAAYVQRGRNPDGTSSTSIALRDLSDGKVYALPAAGEGTFDPAIGPDGQAIAFAKRDASGMNDIWIASRQGGAAVQVTSGFQATSPAWSPDGKWLTFIRTIDFSFKVWAAPMNGATPGTPFELFDPGGIDVPSGLSWTLAAAS